MGFIITQFGVVWTKLWPIYWRLCRIHQNWDHIWIVNFTKTLVLNGSLKIC